MSSIALLTGGASGMGLVTAQALATIGYRVMIADLSQEAAARAARGLPGQGHRGFALDVAEDGAVVEMFAAVEREVGPASVLCTFAGMMVIPEDGSRASIIATSAADWDRTYAVNARGTFLCIREFLRHRTRNPVTNGRIVTISSAAAQIGGYNGSSAYISSKGAVLSLTKSAAREAAPLGITVNTIAPGVIETPLLRRAMPPEADAAYCQKVPLGRLGTSEEIAATVLFLISEGAAYMTGSCLDVNGGFRMQ